MYGDLNQTDNRAPYSPANLRYHPQQEFSTISHQDVDPHYAIVTEQFIQMPRNGEYFLQEHTRRPHQERDAEEKLRKKNQKDRRRNKGEMKEVSSYAPYYMVANNCEEEEKKARKHKRNKKKDFAEVDYYDFQCMIDDYRRDTGMASNLKKDRNIELKKHQRSQSIDQIPTKDVTSDQRILRKIERPRSVERREDISKDKNREYFMKYIPQNPQNPPTNLISTYDQQRQPYIPNEITPIQLLPRKNKDKLKYKKKNIGHADIPEFITLNQLNEQTMNLKDEKSGQRKIIRHHRQRDFNDPCHPQHNKNNLNTQNNNQDIFTKNQEEYNKIVQNYYQPAVANEVEMNKTKKKDKRKDRNKEHKKKEADKEYKAIKKYIKKLAKEQQKEAFFFSTKETGEEIKAIPERKYIRNKTYPEEKRNYETEINQNTDETRGFKQVRKEYIPLDLGLQEIEMPTKHRKVHKKHKNKKEDDIKRESKDGLRSSSLTIREHPVHTNFKDSHAKKNVDDMNNDFKKRRKSETSLDSVPNDKNIVCIYHNKDSPDENDDITTVKLTKKQDCLFLDMDKKCHKKEASENLDKDKERSPYSKNQLILPSEQKKQICDPRDNQERNLLFQKAINRDFPARPRPRLSRSRQRSSKYLKEDYKYIDEKPTKEVHCYDVGTSTILDNNFGDVLELLKGETSVIPPCTNKKRSVFHTKKQMSRGSLTEASKKASGNDERTLGIVVKGIEPPRKIETSKVKSRFKFSSDKNKTNRLECKILSVVAIAPTKFETDKDEIVQNPMKIQSSPQMQHDAEIRNPITDKRLERLLKYYHVEGQSKTKEPVTNPLKLMKELITDKLSDYLKKLQEDKNDEILQIQMDDSKVVKLVLPIEFPDLESRKNIVSLNISQPKESFSDLYMNYSAENEAEEEYFEDHILPTDAGDNKSKIAETFKVPLEKWNSNQSMDSKINEHQYLSNLVNNEIKLNCSPRTNEDCNTVSNEVEFAKDYQFSEKQISRCSSTRFPVYPVQFNGNNIDQREEEYSNTANSLISIDTIEKHWNESMYSNKLAQNAFVESDRNASSNVTENQYLQQKSERIISNDQNSQESKGTLLEAAQEHSYEKCDSSISSPSTREIGKNIQVEKNSDLYDIRENQLVKKHSDAVQDRRSYHKHQTSSKLEFLAGGIENDPINHEIDYFNPMSPRNFMYKETTKLPEKIYNNCDPFSEMEIGDPESCIYENRRELCTNSSKKDFHLKTRAKNIQDLHCKANREQALPSRNLQNDKTVGIIDDSLRNKEQIEQISHIKISREQVSKQVHEVCNEEIIEKTKVSQAQHQVSDDSNHKKGYEYFEIPPPRSKPAKKVAKCSETLPKDEITTKPKGFKSGKTSHIPKRIINTSKTSETDYKKLPSKKKKEENTDEIQSTTWDYQKEIEDFDDSLQKCLQWNVKNSDTVVMSEFNDSTNKTSESTLVPKKSSIPISKKDQNKSQSNQGKCSSAGKEKCPTMLLTKTYKPAGQSSYERRKMYDTRIRKNVKKRSLSESSGHAKITPLVYQVGFCNVYNNRSPFDSGVGGSKSDQNLSNFSVDFENNDFERSVDTLTTVPSCFLKKEEIGEDDLELISQPSCFLRVEDCKIQEIDVSTEPSCLLKEDKYRKDDESFSTEPSCLLKDHKYERESKKFLIRENSCLTGESRSTKSGETRKNKRFSVKRNIDYEDTFSNNSSKNERIQELIRENLLYAKYPPPSKKTKAPNETKKRKKKTEKGKSLDLIKQKSKTKITLKCSRKAQKENGKRLKIVARLDERRNFEEKGEESRQQDGRFLICQDLTLIDKVDENQIRVSLEESKLGFGENYDKDCFVKNEIANDRESEVCSESSRSTLVNRKSSSSVTSQESKETVKEREIFPTSADDSGYLSKGAEVINSETRIHSSERIHADNNTKEYHSEISQNTSGILSSANENPRWNQKDLVKLRVQLLFPYVYDDFELLEKARNTDLIKYYVESENEKLKEAIDAISQKEEMSTRSRSVISLPSVKVIAEEPCELNSVISSVEGGFFNHQKFIAQNNVRYSYKVSLQLNKSEDTSGDCSNTTIQNDEDTTNISNVYSSSASSLKSGIDRRKSVVELFKLRSTSSKRSSCSVFSDETLPEENGDGIIKNATISDEEFYDNFHEIMNVECQKYAKKVRDKSMVCEKETEVTEYEEIPLHCLLKNKTLNSGSNEDCLEPDNQMESEKEETSKESLKKQSEKSFKSLNCDKENILKLKDSISKWEKLPRNKSTTSEMNLDFYPEERMSILDMIQSVQTTNISDDATSSGDLSKQSEKQFFDTLLAFYDKESELIKKLNRDEQFFSSLIEDIRNTEDSTRLIFQRDHRKGRKERKRSILSRFFRWKDKKSTENMLETSSIGKSLEIANSMINENAFLPGESCYSFYRDFEATDKSTTEVKQPNSEHLQQLAYKAKCHLEPMVKATISNSHISDKIKLAGFLKMLNMVAKGEFTFLNNGDNRSLEEKLKEHVAQMFEKVYRIANREVRQKDAIIDDNTIRLLKILVTKYHMGIDSHINVLSIYIGRGLIENKEQLEDAIIFLMGQDSQDVNLEEFEKNCNIASE